MYMWSRHLQSKPELNNKVRAVGLRNGFAVAKLPKWRENLLFGLNKKVRLAILVHQGMLVDSINVIIFN